MKIGRRLARFSRRFGLRGVLCVLLHILSPMVFCVRLRRGEQPYYFRPRSSDLQVFEQIFIDGEYQFDKVRSATAIVDCGANVGYAARYFAEQYPLATVYAVEPEPENYKILIKNASSVERIRPIQAAVWNSDCQLTIANPNAESSAFFLTKLVDGPVSGVRMTTLLKQCGLTSVDLLKLDVEGGEVEVLSDADNWLGAVKYMAIELHDRFRAGCSVALDKALSGRHFVRSERGETTFIEFSGME